MAHSRWPALILSLLAIPVLANVWADSPKGAGGKPKLAAPPAIVVVVAPGGDDKASGTEQKPLATLSGARDAVRGLRAKGSTGPVDVLVKPGIYHVSEPLLLEPQDSGTAAGPTTYRASAEGRVVLSGGLPIKGWQKRDDRVWAAAVPAKFDFRLLRVGERWATRARFPNLDSKNPYTSGWLFADAVAPAPALGSPTKFMRYRTGDLPAVGDLSGAEVHVFIAWGWVNAIVPISRVDPIRRRIEFADKGASQDVRAGNRYFIENVREALDAPGEWFLDKAKSEVLYIPDAPGFPEVPGVAARHDHIIRCVGNPAAGRFVEHVNFTGFHFTDTTYTLTDQYYTPEDACIRMAGTRNCEVRNCDFAWCGGYALRLSDHSERCAFAENRLHHLGQGGVIMVGNTKNQAHHCSVVANRMSNSA